MGLGTTEAEVATRTGMIEGARMVTTMVLERGTTTVVATSEVGATVADMAATEAEKSKGETMEFVAAR